MNRDVEYQLRFIVPPSSAAAVRSAVESATGQCDEVVLSARYFDTPSLLLTRRGASLRLRREAGQWIQTLHQLEGDGICSGVIHLPLAQAALDLPALVDRPGVASLFTDVARAEVLQSRLQPQFQRVFERVRTVVSFEDGVHCVVALNLDAGEYRVRSVQFPMVELTMTLLGGDLRALLQLAMQWQQRHDLVWNPLSTGQVGANLRAHGEFFAVRPGKPVALEKTADVSNAATRMIEHCLVETGVNAARLAMVSDRDTSPSTQETVRQCRRALRRLVIATKLFRRWVDLPPKTNRRALSGIARSLGAAQRDQIFQQRLLRQLYDAGCGPLGHPFNAGPVLQIDAVKTPVQQQLLTLLIWRHSTVTGPRVDRLFSRLLRRHLNRQLRRIRKRCRSFDQASAKDLNRLRRQVRDLSVQIDLCRQILPRRKTGDIRQTVVVVLPLLRTWRALEHARKMLPADPDSSRDEPDRGSLRFASGFIAGRLHGLRYSLILLTRRIARRSLRL
jgi:inorganic triphosphatase YgiF